MAQVNDLLVLGKANFLNEITSTQLLKAHGGIALDSSTEQEESLQYVLGIKPFASGGNIMWSSVSDFANVMRLNATGSWNITAAKATADGSGNVITTTYAIKNHASSATTYGVGDATNYGHVLLYPAASCTTYTSDSGGAITPAAVKKAFSLFGARNGVYYVVGNTSGTAGVWSGTNEEIPELFTGLTIAYKIGIAGGSESTTLNIATAKGASGAKPVKKNAGNTTTHLPVGTVVHLTYDGTNWCWPDYDSNTNTQIRVYRQTSGYDSDYPILVSRTATGSIGTAGSNGTYTAVYGVIGQNGSYTPTINPHTGAMKAYSFTSGAGTSDFSAGTIKFDAISIPDASNSSTFSAGSSGQVLKTNGTTVYWGSDNNTTYGAEKGITLSSGKFGHSNTAITAGSVGSAQTPSHGGTFAIPKITYDAYGHITAATTVNITLPGDNNTDTKVTQNSKSDNVNYPLLGAYAASPTSGTASTVVYDTGMHMNPSTNTITATTFSGTLSGNASSATKFYATKSVTASTQYFIPFVSGSSSGNKDAYFHPRVYLWDTGSRMHLCVGEQGTSTSDATGAYSGGLTINSGSGKGKYVDIIPAAMTGHRTITIPDASGTICLTSHNHNSTYLKLSGGTMTGELNMNNKTVSNIGQLTFADPGVNEGISWTGGNGWNIYESPDNLTNAAGNLQFVHGSTRRLTINADGYVDINARLVVRGNGSSYNEGIRILPASNGWSNIFFSANQTLSNTHDGGWLIGRRGAEGVASMGVTPAVGDFTIEEQDSSGVNLTIHKNSGGATLRGRFRTNSEVQSVSANAFRAVYGNYGVFLRNDGSELYFLITASGDQYGSWNGLRPFYFNLGSGRVTMRNGLTLSGGLTVTGNASISNLLTVATGSSHYGVQLGSTYLNAINDQVIFQNNNGIRFGGDSWDWNVWAGLKYVHSSKYIYLGLADGSVFNANQGQSGGRILTPGISYFHVGNQTSYYFASTGNIYGHEIYSDSWFRTYNSCGWYNETYGCHVRPHTGSYGSVQIHGNARNGYEGLHIGTSNNGMTVMSIAGSHQGLYTESQGRWIIYHNASNGLVGIGASTVDSNHRVTLTGNTWNNGHLTMSGRINLRINGGSWYNPIKSPTDSGIWYDASSATSSTYWAMMSLKFPNTTFSIGGERAGNIFGIYSYANTRNDNGYDGGLYVNGNNHYFYCTTRLYGAVWNDYAEFRTQEQEVAPGYCVASRDNGKIHKTNKRLQACDGIVSDTYGFSIGENEENKTPLAVAGRVLAYCEGDKNDYHAGDTVCASENGKVCKMTREEIQMWPDRIVGTVSEIPDYEIWGTGKVKVNGRIWIKVK